MMAIYDEELYKSMHLDCVNRITQCTDWERSFLSTCGDSIQKRIPLSYKQRQTLEKIRDAIVYESPTEVLKDG